MQSFTQQAKAFEQFLNDNSFFVGNPKNLYAPCQYLLSIGGKRIRPAVCLMASEMFVGHSTQDAYWAAAAVELFHNFTLIHDDIMDQSPLRRGHETVHVKFGTTAGILSGDVMNIYAYKCLENIGEQYLGQVLSLFNQTAIEVCEGQQLDMDFENRNDVTVEEYIEMIGLKTAVLLACSMKMGAIVANAERNDAQLLYDFGKNLGIAFQLQDDYLDTFGDTQVVGKQIGGDIAANKKTFLAITALEKANADQLRQLATLAASKGAEKIEKTIALYKALGVDELSKEAIKSYSRQALQCLEEIVLPEAQKQAYIDLAHFLINREF